MNPRGTITVRHGYTLNHLDNLAHLAGIRAFGRTIIDPLERADLAWMAITEALYEAAERPTPRELLRAGANAIHVWETADQYTHGARRGGKLGAHPGFVAYWWRRSTPSPEDAIVERVAMLEIWPTLKPWQQEALVALAVHDNYDLAATAVGVSYKTFCARVERARRQFLIAWHEHETPSRARFDQRVGRRGA